MEFDNAEYCRNSYGDQIGIKIIIDGVTMSVPIDPNNRHYAEIMRQVEAGTLAIAEADE